MQDRLRGAVVSIALLPVVAIHSGCDGAFKSRAPRASGSTDFELSLTFDDGSDDSTVIEGDATALELQLPASGYRRVVDREHSTVDATRLTLVTDVDLGDPASGGIFAGSDVAQLFEQLGRITVDLPPLAPPRLTILLDSGAPLPFPTGRMLWTLRVRDDIDRESEPLHAALTVRANDRPTAVVRLEIAPPDTTPTGLSLPLDVDGVPFAGVKLPFVVSVHAIPNPTSLAPFTKLFVGGQADPTRLVVTADRDLGDGSSDGFFAGDNLAPRFGATLDVVVDPDTGELAIAALFELDSALAPAVGDTTFTATVTDDDDTPSSPQGGKLRIEERVTLAGHVQPILTANCTIAGCHDHAFPTSGVDLTAGNTWPTTVRVRSNETPDDSCATLLVDPYSGDGSYLLQKVDGTFLDGCVEGAGVQMPNGAPPLSTEEIALIERWILQGAHDD